MALRMSWVWVDPMKIPSSIQAAMPTTRGQRHPWQKQTDGPQDPPLPQNQNQTVQRPDHQRADHDGRNLDLIADSTRLRRHTGGPHPQKAEDPIAGRQHHGTQPHGGQRGRQPRLTDNPGVNRPKQRHCGV